MPRHISNSTHLNILTDPQGNVAMSKNGGTCSSVCRIEALAHLFPRFYVSPELWEQAAVGAMKYLNHSEMGGLCLHPFWPLEGTAAAVGNSAFIPPGFTPGRLLSHFASIPGALLPTRLPFAVDWGGRTHLRAGAEGEMEVPHGTVDKMHSPPHFWIRAQGQLV